MPTLHATRRQALAQLLFVALTAVACAGLLCAAVLVPAPVVVLPAVALVCIGLPMAVATELPAALARMRAAGAFAQLRRQLDELPVVDHPHGF